MSRKPCRKFGPEDFKRYENGTLSKWQHWRMETHFRLCMNCLLALRNYRRVWDPDSETDMLMETWVGRAYGPAPLNNSLRERIWEQIAAEPASASVPVAAPAQRINPFPVAGRWAIGGIATAIAAVGATMYFLPGTPVQPVVAFARVEEAMRNVEAVTWTETVSFHRELKGRTSDINRQYACWVTLTPPRFASRETSAPQLIVQGTNRPLPPRMWRVGSLWDGETMISYTQDILTYQRSKAGYSFGGRWGNTPRERIRDLVLFRPPSGAADGGGTETSTLPGGKQSDWQSTKDVLGGRQVLRFESKWTRTASLRTTRRQETIWKIWVDPKTYRVIRREVRALSRPPMGGTAESVTISDNYRYNETVPTERFSVPVPPVGTTYQFTNPEPGHNDRDLASPGDAERIKAVLRKAWDAWNRRDRDAFAAQWDFTFNERKIAALWHTPFDEKYMGGNGRRWLAMLESPEINREWPIESFEYARTKDTLYERESVRDPFPPTRETRPVVYQVSIRYSSKKQRPRSDFDIDTIFTLRRIGDDFRLIYIDTRTRASKPKSVPSRPSPPPPSSLR
jgi:hypothetical protein